MAQQFIINMKWGHCWPGLPDTEMTAWNLAEYVVSGIPSFTGDNVAQGWKVVTFHVDGAPSHMMVSSAVCTVQELPLLFTQSIQRCSPGSQVFWGTGDLLQHLGTLQGTEDKGSHPLLQVEYTRGSRFGSILS